MFTKREPKGSNTDRAIMTPPGGKNPGTPQDQFRIMFDCAPVGMAMADLDGVLLIANSRFAELLGCSEHEIVGQSVLSLTHPDDRDATRDHMVELLNGESRDYRIEKRYLRKDGSILWSLTSVSLVRDADGAPLRFAGVLEDITDKKKTEADLKASEERFRAIVQASPECVKIVDADGTLLNMNSSGLTMVEADHADEVLGKCVYGIIAPEFREAFTELNAAVCSGESRRFAYEIIGLRGSRRWMETHAVPLMDPSSGKMVQLAVTRDATSRRLAEEKLRRSEEELRALANSIPQLAWMAEPNGDIFWYNERWYEYTGTTLKEMAGWGWKMVHHPDILPQVVDAWQKAINTGERFEMEFPLRGADGVFRWFLTQVQPMKDDRGKVTRWFGTNTDVDQVRQVREALHEETRNLETLNRSGIAIASTLDIQVVLQTVTDAATQVSGAKFGAFFYNTHDENGDAFMLYTLSGAPREAFAKFGHPRATPIFAPTFRGEGVIRLDDVLKDSRYGTMAPHFGMPEGHLPVRSYLAVPVISRSGEVFGGLFLGHSQPGMFTEKAERLVTGMAAQAAIAIDNGRLYQTQQQEVARLNSAQQALQQARDDLRIANELLEERVRERTAELRKAVEQMEEFSYTVSHDLRAPLRSINGYAALLEEDHGTVLPEMARTYLDAIRRSCVRMDKLTTDVLLYSRVSRGELQLSPIELEPLLSELVAQYPFHSPNAVITLETPMLNVLAHESSLAQAVTNLITNAVKFSRPGVHPQIRIYTESRGEFVRIWVQDNGIGIEPAMQSRLFRVFERINPTQGVEGTGIGLAIVRKTVEKMGGSAGVVSDGKTGSSFWIELRKV